MQFKHKSKHPVILGTILLSSAGILCKIIGFFYKIFLSRVIGAEGLGLYHLIFPISTICFSITVAGLSTALSKYIAEFQEKAPSLAGRFLHSCLIFSTSLSLLLMGLVYHFADFLSTTILLEPRCTPLIQILALSIPFASIHSCIHGYYYGKKQALIPSLSTLIEQSFRVLFVVLAFYVQKESGHSITVSSAVWGIVVGEGVAFLFCITTLALSPQKTAAHKLPPPSIKHPGLKLMLYALPLSANRLTLTLFSSFESILIPARLRLFGYNHTEALSVYGVLTGMAFSIVTFPSVFTNAVSVMLLPIISEADSKKDTKKIKQTIRFSILGCLFLGSLCTFGLLLTGNWIGEVIFCNSLAGKFITMLSFICPFMFLNSILSSTMHGLGMTMHPFLLNLLGSSIRIGFVFFLIPMYGLKAYLIGMLLSQMVVAVASIVIVTRTAGLRTPLRGL